MADASRSAAANTRKGGLTNALFLVESAECLPGPLASSADLVTVVLPWGSLLRGVLDADAAIAQGLCNLLRPDGELLLFLSEIDQPAVDDLLERLVARGLRSLEVREAVEWDVRTLSSGWARRLGIPGSRPAWIIRLCRKQLTKEEGSLAATLLNRC